MKRLWIPAALVALILLTALAAPLLGLPDPVRQDVANRLAGAMPGSPLGRDEFGRDVFSRLIWGARVSLGVAFASALIACGLGTALGLIGGWLRGVSELVTVRAIDIILCFPPILLALLVVTILGPGAATLILVLSVLYTPGFARVAYAEVLSAGSNDYAEAVRALGASTPRILARTILPNIAGPVLVQLSLTVAAAMVVESGLSFLGLGVVPPSPSWGLMIRGARSTMEQAPLLLLWPCAALTVTILAMNLLCDALRDAIDPRGKKPQARGLSERLLPGFGAVSAAPAAADDAVINVKSLTVEIATPQGLIRPVDGVSFDIRPGETLAIVGESGSGKSLTAAAIMGLLPPEAIPGGEAVFSGKNLLALPEPELRAMRGSRLAMIFQDPMSSLNPVHRAGRQVAEAIRAHRELTEAEARAEALELFRRAGIADPERRLDAWPHELSGGMRQRVMIAMAIANRPALLIADEPTTALDVTVQAQILDLLAGLKRETGMALIFITHNLGVVAEIADRVMVMYAGEAVESGPAGEVFAKPLHPYTRALLAAMPGDSGAPAGIPGAVPLPHQLPDGCRFAPRCGVAEDRCRAARIPLVEAAPGRRTRCLRWRELPAGAAA